MLPTAAPSTAPPSVSPLCEPITPPTTAPASVPLAVAPAEGFARDRHDARRGGPRRGPRCERGRVEARLLPRPGVALVAILVELRLRLAPGRIHEHPAAAGLLRLRSVGGLRERDAAGRAGTRH